MKSPIFIIVFVLFWSLTLAQESDVENKAAFEFSYANDVTGMTDQYFTNGVGFSLTLPVFKFSPFNPSWLRNSQFSHAYHNVNFQYDVFTPDLRADLYTDRPFAATMMLGSKHQYVYNQKSIRLTSELKLGLMGQAAGAGVLQNGLHELMPGADRVEGWQTQMRNDLALNYIFGLEKQFLLTEHVDFIGGATAFLGMPYTKLETSAQLRLGIFNHYFDFLNNHPKRRWEAFFTIGATGSLVAYNATLQGGLFNQNNPYELDQINHLVGSYHLGIGVTYRKTSLLLKQVFITPEFSGADSHSWGELQLIFRF